MALNKTLTRAYCSIKRMRVLQPIDVPALSIFDKFQSAGLPGMPKGVDAQSILHGLGDPVQTMDFDSTQLDINMTIDFDTETVFSITIWNLASEKDIRVGDQVQLKIWWKDYEAAADSLIVSGFVTETSRKISGSDVEYTIKGDIVTEWALTYLKPEGTPTVLFTMSQFLRMIRNAGIKDIKYESDKLPMPLLVKNETIRELLNMIISTMGSEYTWKVLNDIIFFYKKGECISESINVIDLNTSDVIGFEIDDSRIHITTYGIPELDDGSIFKYDGNIYFVDTIKHTLHYKNGYTSDIYAEVKSNVTTQE